MAGPGPEPGIGTGPGLTQLTVVIHQDDFVQQVGRRAVQYAVHGPQQSREGLVEEADDHAGRRQRRGIHLVPTPADRQTDGAQPRGPAGLLRSRRRRGLLGVSGVWQLAVGTQSGGDQDVEGVSVVAAVPQLLVRLAEDHSWRRDKDRGQGPESSIRDTVETQGPGPVTRVRVRGPGSVTRSRVQGQGPGKGPETGSRVRVQGQGLELGSRVMDQGPGSRTETRVQGPRPLTHLWRKLCSLIGRLELGAGPVPGLVLGD